MFEGTVAENIARFGEVDAEKGGPRGAACRGARDRSCAFPRATIRRSDSGAAFLSGGQRQRIALARALYGDPVLVVLDEPNSNLDDVGEQALVRAVLDLKAQGSTVVLITHRTNIVGVVDRLMVLRDGSLQLFGPRNEVLAALAKAAQAAQPALPQTGGAA